MPLHSLQYKYIVDERWTTSPCEAVAVDGQVGTNASFQGCLYTESQLTCITHIDCQPDCDFMIKQCEEKVLTPCWIERDGRHLYITTEGPRIDHMDMPACSANLLATSFTGLIVFVDPTRASYCTCTKCRPTLWQHVAKM